MARKGSRPHLFETALAAFVLCASLPAAGAERRPVPSMMIYPGDIIRDEMLVEKDFPDAVSNSMFVGNRRSLVGKVSKRTLLPDQPIAVNAIGEPRLVTVGAMVRLVYEEDGLSISTYAAALQAGAAGDVISVRNRESGVVVSGVIQADGSIHVGSG